MVTTCFVYNMFPFDAPWIASGPDSAVVAIKGNATTKTIHRSPSYLALLPPALPAVERKQTRGGGRGGRERYRLLAELADPVTTSIC